MNVLSGYPFSQCISGIDADLPKILGFYTSLSKLGINIVEMPGMLLLNRTPNRNEAVLRKTNPTPFTTLSKH
jgi:hypothetical protein